MRTTWSDENASTSPLSNRAMPSSADGTGTTSESTSIVFSAPFRASIVVVLVTTATRLPLRPERLGTLAASRLNKEAPVTKVSCVNPMRSDRLSVLVVAPHKISMLADSMAVKRLSAVTGT